MKSALLLVAAGLAGCHSAEGMHAGVAPGAASGTSAPAAAEGPAAPVPLARCRALPPDTRPPNPDFPAPRNSDHTLKRLPPGPPGHYGTSALFRYADFGPQAMQNGLLGHEWWSWEAGGSFEPGDEFDVRVVVYQKRTRKQVAAEYPTVRGKSDYRLVDRKPALAYLDKQIAWLARQDPHDHDWRPLQKKLERTRQIIVRCLP